MSTRPPDGLARPARCGHRGRFGSCGQRARSSTWGERRGWRWLERRALGELANGRPGGSPCTSEETSTQVEIVFTDALAAEGLLAQVEARADGLVDLSAADEALPILLAVSNNGPQMTSGSTRDFMAPCAIACHFG